MGCLALIVGVSLIFGDNPDLRLVGYFILVLGIMWPSDPKRRH